MSGPTVDFWQTHFDAGRTPWDRGAASPQLSRWMDTGALAPCRIVVPGCGSGHEVVRLAQAGFDVTGLDYAPAAVARTRAALQASGVGAAVVEADVLTWSPRETFDAIYEQTCLCALHPDHWVAYAQRLHTWLRPGGSMFALFMQAVRPAAADGVIEGPPYHCDINAMRALFDAARWTWPKPPYERVPHPMRYEELAAVLARR
jgi:2-polyprenyl-3-methyl-5-hydroxy-6-metoxy-1,4-benzoquinol methylase